VLGWRIAQLGVQQLTWNQNSGVFAIQPVVGCNILTVVNA
jgi:hypothetical protein